MWSCPPDKRCGGYGDRMKGITSGFLIALLTRRAFGIWHTDPVELRGLLRPAGPVPWDQLPANRSYPVRIKDKPPRSGKDVITKMPATVWLETNQVCPSPSCHHFAPFQPPIQSLSLSGYSPE